MKEVLWKERIKNLLNKKNLCVIFLEISFTILLSYLLESLQRLHTRLIPHLYKHINHYLFLTLFMVS